MWRDRNHLTACWLRTLAMMILLFGLVAVAQPATAEVIKKCSACGAIVPSWSQAGNTCPYCGAYWGNETWSSGGPSYFNPAAAWAMFRFLQWQQLYQQRLLEHQEYTEGMQELRDHLIEKRKHRRDRIQEATELFRLRDDPVQRAERYVAAGLGSEADGALDVAAAYYRLATGLVPNSLPGRAAADALARLGQ